jgi:signal transduction histidine kinase
MKWFRGGTSGFTSGLRQTTWRKAPLKIRLAGFAVVVTAVALLIIRIDTSIWRQQAQLQEEFAAVRAEKFYFGVNFRMSLRQIREAWLDLYLTGNPADRDAFQRQAAALRQWLRGKERNFQSPNERERFQRLEAAYDDFIARLDRLREKNGPRPSRQEFATAYEESRTASKPLLDLCAEVVAAEHEGFDLLLRNSDQTLFSLQRLLLLSLVLLVVSATALAVVVYRGMIAPLRAQLSESQAIIERQEKLASLGTLGAGVAHEIRNPLQAIKFRLFSLKSSLPPGFADNEDAKVITEEINRLDRIVKDFLRFARPSEPELIRVPAGQILREAYDLMKSQIKATAVQLSLEIVDPVWVQADPQQIKQALINLVQNSADSIGPQGRITLCLKRDMTKVAGSTRPVAVLAVADTGKGIPPEVQKRLFDPFFTTKEDGTGLGLAIAARIAEKHGGLLRYRTQMNRGTTFEIVLPALKDDATENTAHRG